MSSDAKPKCTVFAGSCCCGIPVYIHYYLFILVFFQTVFAFFQEGFGNDGLRLALFNFILYGPILFGTVLVHELGHCAAARYVGGQAEQILLWPMGGLAYVAHSNAPWDDIKVAIAGPLTHIPMAGIWLALEALLAPTMGDVSFRLNLAGSLNEPQSFACLICESAVMLQISLFAFNLLLPAYPLDGGRVFANALRLCDVETNKAAKITAVTAITIALGIAGLGIYQMVVLQNPFSILSVLIAAWVIWNSWELWVLADRGDAGFHPLFGGSQIEMDQ